MIVSVVDVGDVRADAVQEVPVVRDDDERAFVAAEKLLQPVDRVEVQVVRRLIEQQRLGLAVEGLRQEHPDFLSALQLGHRPVVERIWDVEPLQQHGGGAVRRVAVLLADDAFELAEAHGRPRSTCRREHRARLGRPALSRAAHCP